MTGKTDTRRWRTRRGAPPGAAARILLLLLAACLLPAGFAWSAVETVDGGIRFTYYDPDAGNVFLAGSFNGWNATATPMTRDDDGYWRVTMRLDPGKHDYKFVVDGAWITDFENPASASDGYGGTNSVVEVSAAGEIVTSGETAARPVSNTPLSPKVYIGGRYLTRSLTEKDVEEDSRWRMQRPSQNVDFNFLVTISDIVRGYTRLRIDSELEIQQPNNISATLDEAHIDVDPAAFHLRGYYNEEAIRTKDPFELYGDADLPGTIFDDHLAIGKGTAGALFSIERRGVLFDAFAANVHDYDIYNDPGLFDNTGTDLYGARLSRRWRLLDAGLDFFAERNVWWLNFTELIGQTPSNTGIPALDDYIDRTGDPSDWFEFDDKTWLSGVDLSLDLADGGILPQFEALFGKQTQGFVTSNRSGIDLDNSPIDVTTYDRDMLLLHGSVKSTIVENLLVNIEHTRHEQDGAGGGESYLSPAFLPDAEADKHIFFTVSEDPAEVTSDYSELYLAWDFGRGSAKLWLQRNETTAHLSSGDELWWYDVSLSPGLVIDPVDRLHIEIEHQYRSFEGSYGEAMNGASFETIARGAYALTDHVDAVFDLRHIRYAFDGDASWNDETFDYVAPFVGFRYTPMKKVSVLLAYGYDPVSYLVDYEGRQIGRWLLRRRYMLDNPGSSFLDAEEALEDGKAITLRAIFTF